MDPNLDPCGSDLQDTARDYLNASRCLMGRSSHELMAAILLATLKGDVLEEDAAMGADNADNVAPSATVDKLYAISRNTVWDGAAWDRMPGTSTDGVLVNLGSNNDVTVTSGNIEVSNDAGNPIPVTLPTASRTTAISTVTAAGSTSAGIKSVTFVVGTGPVTIGGSTFATGDIVTVSAPGADTLASIAYDATGGSLKIITLT